MWVFRIYFALFVAALVSAQRADAFPDRSSSTLSIGVNHSTGVGNLGYALLIYLEQYNLSQDGKYRMEYQFDAYRTWICAADDIQIQNYAHQNLRQFLQQFDCFDVELNDRVFTVTIKQSTKISVNDDYSAGYWCRCDSSSQEGNKNTRFP